MIRMTKCFFAHKKLGGCKEVGSLHEVHGTSVLLLILPLFAFINKKFPKDSELADIESNILPKVIRTAKRNNKRCAVEKLKTIDYELLWELMKDSRRSDRQLAKALGTSQPTVTRRRANLEKKFIDGYTAIPKWEKIGFELVAFSFVRHKIKFAKPDVREASFRKVKEWMMKQPNVILAIAGQGMGWDGIFVSFHKSYSDFAEFMRKHNSELSEFLIDSQSFIADINPTTIRKPFHLKYLAETK
jgi:DNA-binding Lrp family transcriptional regulator